ncbi:hypothetical protein DRQ25_14525 [Candidatus Fermentibacteria bacterium]|nr:MAG: hypothetical protein DRQ25_14525 [Candidatus Fermentibacteria bacterium]
MTVTINDFPNAHMLVKWVEARESARTMLRSGDPNIDNWRYCNVRRQHDKVTIAIAEWLRPHWEDDMLIPNTIMARLFNNPDTLDKIGYLEHWDPMRVKSITYGMQEEGRRVFNAAYIVSTNGHKMDKVEYLCEYVLGPAFTRGIALDYPDLDDMWRALIGLNGIGSFMAAQVVADLKFTPRWRKAPDWWSFVAPGPGSMRGLNRLRGLPANAQKYNQKAFSMYIQPVRAIISSGTGIELCAQDAQNCLCEFDKYMRLINGEGRPKQKYKRHG